MACPFFHPLARFESDSWVVPPRLPLGDAYTGECRAAESAFQPDETRMRQICNLGYGRGRCERFPETASADAVRFHIVRDEGDLLRIQYVMEKDCWPQSHGEFDYSVSNRRTANGPDDAVLTKQAGAFVESYLRRRI